MDSNATISKTTLGGVTGTVAIYYMVASSGTRIDSNTADMTYAADKSKSKYPTNGKNSSDGCWYAYHKQMGE